MKKLSALLALLLAFCMLFTACSTMSSLTGEMDEDAAAPTEMTTEPAETATEPVEPTTEPAETATEPAETATELNSGEAPETVPAPELDSIALETDSIALETDSIALETEGAEPAENVASVAFNDETTYYTSFGEAWTAVNAAPATAFVVVTLLEDVNSLDDKLTVTDRTSWLVLDLNDHTLSRGLTEATESGEVFCLGNSGYVTIKNGTITGGKSTTNGGGIRVDSDHLELHLENLTITGNSSANAGGGVYIEGCNADVYMTNVTVTGNTCTGNGAGGIHWAKDGDKMAALTLGGTVKITGNSASNCCDDLMAMSYPSGTCKLAFDGLSADSCIGFAFEYNAEGTIVEGLGDKAEALVNCFTNEAGSAVQITAENGSIFFAGPLADGANAAVSPADGAKAAVYYQNEWHYYDTFAQAWATANAWNKENCKFMLLADWIADENGSFDDHGGYGENGWGFYKGMLNPRDRGDDGGDKDSWLIVDLNGYTIDKNLYSAGDSHNWANPEKNNRKENGRIFYLDSYDSNFNMTIENGTLRGANTEDEGGAIWVDDEDVNLCLENLTITDNCAEEDGGAIWVDDCDSVVLTDVDIEWNFCSKNSNDVGAAVLDDGDFSFYGTVHIRENFSRSLMNEEHGQNNLVLGDYIEVANVTGSTAKPIGSKEFSEIRLTKVTLSKVNGRYQSLTDPADEIEDLPSFTYFAFYFDKSISDESATEICRFRNAFFGIEYFAEYSYAIYYSRG